MVKADKIRTMACTDAPRRCPSLLRLALSHCHFGQEPSPSVGGTHNGQYCGLAHSSCKTERGAKRGQSLGLDRTGA